MQLFQIASFILICYHLPESVSFQMNITESYSTSPMDEHQDCLSETTCRNRLNLNMKMFRENDTCFDDLGCFINIPPWHTPKRPAKSPWAPEKVFTNAILVSRNTSFENLEVFPTISRKWETLLNKDLNTTIICHGFRDGAHESWIGNLTQALLKRQGQNVIIVDWAKGSGKLYPNRMFYLQAIGNCRVVGAIMTKLVIYFIEKVGITPEQIHLIGHSLGAHCLAYMSKAINGSIRRFTGLDPAGPLFHLRPKEVRMDANDAKFTEVVHTNTGISGIVKNVGHCDFYMNLGVFQPGCSKMSSAIRCAHEMAPLFYSSSIENPNCFLARPASILAVSGALVNSMVTDWLSDD